MIIDHNHPIYLNRWKYSGDNRYNGAFYYSQEIVKNIIPNVKTNRNWITINVKGQCRNHSIVFIHNNLHPERYNWLKKYHDLILVCGIPETLKKVAHLGKPIYLPLSIDVEYVEQFKRPKTKQYAFVGRKTKRTGKSFHREVDFIEGLPREQLLPLMAEYQYVYAVGRTAIEAKALGCQVLFYDDRFPDVGIWDVIDNKDAALMLQEMIDKIDLNL